MTPNPMPQKTTTLSHRNFTVLLLATALIGLVSTGPANAKKPHAAVASVRVDGLACPFCAFGLEKKLKELDFVQEIAIEVDGARADLVLKKGKVPDFDAVEQAVTDAGFTARETSMVARGTVQKSGNDWVLVVDGGARLTLEGEKLAALKKTTSGKNKVHVQISGPAVTKGRTTYLTVASFKKL